MVDAADSEFEGKLAALKGPWNKIERECKRVIPGKSTEAEFYFWFVSKKRDIVHNNMLKAVRVAAQLGNPTEKFYINASEPTNVLKLKVDRKPQSCPFLLIMYKSWPLPRRRTLKGFLSLTRSHW